MSSSKHRTNLNPKEWGPCAWLFMDSATEAHSTPPSNKETREMRKFISSFKLIQTMQEKKHLLKLKTSKDRDSLREWFENYKKTVNDKK